MELKIKVMNKLCTLETFEINGIDAWLPDFVYSNFGGASKRSQCKNKRVFPLPYTDSVLSRYNITVDEYNQVVAKCIELLSFGSCNYCQ